MFKIKNYNKSGENKRPCQGKYNVKMLLKCKYIVLK